MAAPPAKPQFHWKLLVAPVVLMGMSKAGLNYEQPAVRLSFRGAYVVSHILVAVLLWYLYQEIKKRADPKKPVKIKESSDDGTKPALYLTERQYDLSELQKHAQHFGIGILTTLLLHYYFSLWPALVLQIVMQPVQLYDLPLFQIYILGKDHSDHPKLARPFGVKLPTPRWRDAPEEEQAAAEGAAGDGEADEPEPLEAAPEAEASELEPEGMGVGVGEAGVLPLPAERTAAGGEGLRQRQSVVAGK